MATHSRTEVYNLISHLNSFPSRLPLPVKLGCSLPGVLPKILTLVSGLKDSLIRPVAYEAPLSMEFSRQEYWSGLPFPPPEDLPDPGIETRSPALQADSLPAEPQGKPKNAGVGSLSLLQGVFPTQESNWGLLHCRRILYQLSYQGNPRCWWTYSFMSSSMLQTAYIMLVLQSHQ